jgi:hypothetical protein
MAATLLLLRMLFLLLPGSVATSTCYATAISADVNLQTGPAAMGYTTIGKLAYNMSLPVVGRNDQGDWYAVDYTTTEGQQGAAVWVAEDAVQLSGECSGLDFVPAPDYAEKMAPLMEVPILPTLDVETLRGIFQHGQTLGNHPELFTKVGDCNTASAYFLSAFDGGTYDLGPYQDLQSTIDFFAGSFAHESLAGVVGFNARIMFDPLFVHPSMCNPDEGPLPCEYRRERPSVAVIMLGANDFYNLTEDQFTDALTRMVQLSLDEGVIPVLTTFPWHQDRMWDKALQLNLITVDIANQYHVPLINLWRAAQNLPNLGLVFSYTHLTDSGFGIDPYKIIFQGQETFSGHALRNLLTLQVLDMLRRDVLTTD